MIQRTVSTLLLGTLLALPARGQEACSSLAITTTLDPVRPVQTVAVDVQGVQPGALVYLVAGPNAGSTTLNFRALGTLELGLARPFSATLIGTADGKGGLSRSQRIPSDLALTLQVQAVGFRLVSGKGTPKADFCTSNVIQVEL